MRIAVMGILILLNYVLQTSVLPQIAILGVTPDTALVFIVCYGILRGDVEGALFGFSAGLLQDMFSGGPLGMFALIGFLVGYASGKPFRDFFKDNYFLPFIVVLVAVFFQQFVIYIGSFLFLGYLNIWHFVWTIMIPTAIYTVSLAIPLYSLMHFINGLIEKRETDSRDLFERGRE